MANSKLSALSELTAAQITDLMHIIDDPSGTPTSKKAEIGSVLVNGGGITRLVIHEEELSSNGIFEVDNIPQYFDDPRMF